jgi:DNA topoisomerase IB
MNFIQRVKETYGEYGMNKEVANLPPSHITVYSSFLITVGLQWLAKTDSGKKISKSFSKQLEAKLNKRVLREMGMKGPMFTTPDNPKTMQLKSLDIKRIIRKEISNDPMVSRDELKYLRFAVNFMENPHKEQYLEKARTFASQVSPSFMRNFDKVVSKIGNDEVEKKVVSSQESVLNLYSSLEQLYTKLTGKKPGKNLSIPVEELKALKAKSKSSELDVKAYRAAKRRISKAYDLDFASFMSTHNEPVPVATAYKHMADLGYRDQKLVDVPEKAPLRVGVDLGKIKYFTEDGKALSGGIPPNATIQFNRKYDPKTGKGAYIAYKTPNAAGVTRMYTVDHITESTEKKFSTAQKINTKIDKTVRRWTKDLSNSSPVVRMASTVAMLIYLTGARVGARQNSAAAISGEKTFGIISLRPAHVIIKSNAIRLKYKGKKGGLQNHIIPVKDIPSKKILKNLKEFKEGKKGDDLIFSLKDKKGKTTVLTYSGLNKYLKSTGYVGGAHKMRHVRGTNLLIEGLNSKKWSPSNKANNLSKKQKEADTYIINEVIVPVTKLLGHKSGDGKDLWRTTIKSYINPEPLHKWYSDQGLRKPSWLPAKAEAKG